MTVELVDVIAAAALLLGITGIAGAIWAAWLVTR
jgi:hypothetical protein